MLSLGLVWAVVCFSAPLMGTGCASGDGISSVDDAGDVEADVADAPQVGGAVDVSSSEDVDVGPDDLDASSEDTADAAAPAAKAKAKARAGKPAVNTGVDASVVNLAVTEWRDMKDKLKTDALTFKTAEAQRNKWATLSNTLSSNLQFEDVEKLKKPLEVSKLIVEALKAGPRWVRRRAAGRRLTTQTASRVPWSSWRA